MKEQIKGLISDQWGNFFGKDAAAEQIVQLMCDKCTTVFMDAKPDTPDWGVRETMICYGFTEQQVKVSYEKLKIR